MVNKQWYCGIRGDRRGIESEYLDLMALGVAIRCAVGPPASGCRRRRGLVYAKSGGKIQRELNLR